MADLYIRELEEKVAHYETIMSRCPQCKTTLPTPEAETTTASSRQSRSRRSAQQPTAKVAPPAITSHSGRPVSEADPITESSRQPRSSRSAQKPAARVASPAPTGHSERPPPEADPVVESSRQSRSSRSAQKPAAKLPSPALTGHSKPPAPEADPVVESSRQSRSSRSAQQPAAKVVSPVLASHSERPAPEADPATESSRQSRSSRSAQQAPAIVPAPAHTDSSKRPAPASTISSSAQSSKQPHTASGTKVQAGAVQESIPPAASSDRSHQIAEAPVSTLRHPSTNSSAHPTTVSVSSSAADSSIRPPPSSHASTTLPSSLGLPTADARDHHGGKLVDIDLPQYKSQNRGGRPPGETPKFGTWIRTADIMLEEIPSGRHWREKLERIDNSIIAAVAMDVAPIPEGDVSLKENAEGKELTRLVRRFAERQCEGRLNFQHFILVCLCNVLSFQGVPRDKIVETLQICISDTTQHNIVRYLKGATWLNKLMNELFLTDWGYRAVDLIAIWNRPAATYGRLGAAPDSRQHFITDLTQCKYFEGYQEVPDRSHDTIPWIVKKELGDEVSYGDICKALGYSYEYFMKTRKLHSSQPPSPNPDSGSSADEDAIHGKQSSHSGRNSASHASRHQGQISAGVSRNRTSASTMNLTDDMMIRRQLHLDDSPDDSGGRKGQIASENVASQRKKRMVPDRSAKPLEDPDVTRQRRKPYEEPSLAELPVSTSLGENSASSTQQPASADNAPPRHPVYGDPHLKESPRLPRTSFQNASRDHAASTTSQIVASSSSKNIVPDRSIKALGGPDVARRRKPDDTPSFAELPVSTSLGEPAPGMQSTKRPLPESPTSAFQPINATRRRQHVVERSSSEEISPPSHSGKRGSNNQRRRA